MSECSQRTHTKCQSQGAMAGHGHLLVHPRNLVPATSPQIHKEDTERKKRKNTRKIKEEKEKHSKEKRNENNFKEKSKKRR